MILILSFILNAFPKYLVNSGSWFIFTDEEKKLEVWKDLVERWALLRFHGGAIGIFSLEQPPPSRPQRKVTGPTLHESLSRKSEIPLTA